MDEPTVVVLGTLDTKFDEFVYLCSQISRQKPRITPVNRYHADVLAACISRDVEVLSLPRGEVIKTMIDGATNVVKNLHEKNTIHGIISAGGSGGTSLASAVMRNGVPIGFPKLIVSTVASADTSPYVGETDITLMYSVVDISGLNHVLKGVLSNAAGAIAGMARAYKASLPMPGGKKEKRKKSIAITMFGVTTPAVDTARAVLVNAGFEVFVFHATGAGELAMERLVRERRLDGVLDLTTTELADELVGGIFSAGSDRLTAAVKAGLPQVVSCGALDMVNFGPRSSVPGKFRGRNLFEHNPSITLMRTSVEECGELGRRISERLKMNCIRPDLTEVCLPLKGVSAIAVEGQPFYESGADKAVFDAIRTGLAGTGVSVVETDAETNDKKFAESMAERLLDLISKAGEDAES